MKYYVIINNVQQGPFSVEELAGRKISSDTPVWTEGMGDWTRADAVPQLASLFAGQGSTPPVYRGVASSSEKQPGYFARNKKWIIDLVCSIALIVLLVSTNPSEDKHREAVQEASAKAMSEEVSENTLIGGDILGDVVGGIKGYVDAAMLERLNLFVCSFGVVDDEMVSFGILGMVFTFNLE